MSALCYWGPCPLDTLVVPLCTHTHACLVMVVVVVVHVGLGVIIIVNDGNTLIIIVGLGP